MRVLIKPLAIALVVGATALVAPPAQAARVGIGIGIGIPFGGYYGPGYYGPGYYRPGYWGPYGDYAPRYLYYPAPAVVVQGTSLPATPAAPNPIFYPNNGQSSEQSENDRQACNRWAATQPAAMADASVFQRATYACMEGRGYTVK